MYFIIIIIIIFICYNKYQLMKRRHITPLYLPSTTATFLCPQGGRYGEVRLYLYHTHYRVLMRVLRMDEVSPALKSHYFPKHVYCLHTGF